MVMLVTASRMPRGTTSPRRIVAMEGESAIAAFASRTTLRLVGGLRSCRADGSNHIETVAMLTRKRVFTSVVLTVWLAGCSLADRTPDDGPLPAGGIATHLGYFDTSYADVGAAAVAVKDVEAKIVRDSVSPGQDPGYYARIYEAFRHVAAVSGAKFLLIATRADDPVAAQLDAVAPLVADGIVWGIEGANEWDNVAGRTDPSWRDQLREHQTELYQQVKARWPHLPVVGPSLSLKKSGSQLGDLSDFLDYGNFHYYGLVSGINRRDLRERLVSARVVSGARPMWATEANGIIGDGYRGDEQDQARVMRQLYRILGARGIERVVSYELVNEGLSKHPPSHRENNFGSYKLGPDGAWERKPVFFEVRTANRRG